FVVRGAAVGAGFSGFGAGGTRVAAAVGCSNVRVGSGVACGRVVSCAGGFGARYSDATRALPAPYALARMPRASAGLPSVATPNTCKNIRCSPFIDPMGSRDRGTRMIGGSVHPSQVIPRLGGSRRLAEGDRAQRELAAPHGDRDLPVERTAARRVVIPEVQRDRLALLRAELQVDPSLDRPSDAEPVK